MADKAFFPTCRFCKQQVLPTALYKSQEEADEAATITCNCYEAKQYQHEIERQKERENNIIKLTQRLDDFATYCETRGVELKGDLHRFLLKTGIAVLDGIVSSVNVKFARFKVNISQNNKGNIVIHFTYTDGASVEV